MARFWALVWHFFGWKRASEPTVVLDLKADVSGMQRELSRLPPATVWDRLDGILAESQAGDVPTIAIDEFTVEEIDAIHGLLDDFDALHRRNPGV